MSTKTPPDLLSLISKHPDFKEHPDNGYAQNWYKHIPTNCGISESEIKALKFKWVIAQLLYTVGYTTACLKMSSEMGFK